MRRERRGCDEQDDALLFTLPSCGATALMVVGVVLGYHFLHVTCLVGFHSAAVLLDQETSFHFLEQLIGSVIILACAVFIVGLVGWVGDQQQSRSLICVYIVLCFVLSIISFGMFLHWGWLEYELSARIIRKGEDICNTTRHAMYSVMLDCPFAIEKSASSLKHQCDKECEVTVEQLRSMKGCDLMKVLCHSFEYSIMGYGECLTHTVGMNGSAKSSTIKSLTKPASKDCCRKACDSAILCRGFVFDNARKECELLSPVLPWRSPQSSKLAEDSKNEAGVAGMIEKMPQSSKEPQNCSEYVWDAPEDLDTEVSEEIAENQRIFGAAGETKNSICWRKEDKTSTIENVIKGGHVLMFCNGIVCMVLLLSGTCGCFLQYFLVDKRERQKGHSMSIMKHMFCPHCEGDGGSDFFLDCDNGGDRQKGRRRLSTESDDDSASDGSSPAASSKRSSPKASPSRYRS